ncbi:hypothetical protein MJO29_017084, partial [Puccinia striiformis f. sp. tritici]
ETTHSNSDDFEFENDPEDEIETAERELPLAEDRPEETEDQEADINIKSEDSSLQEFFDLESNASEDSDIEITQMLAPAATSTRVLRDRTSKVKPVKYSYLTSDPTSFKKAMTSTKKEDWKIAAQEEINNIEAHNVWEDMWERPNSFLYALWIFKTKPATLSSAERKKARLVIQGFLQIPGDEYGDTFAPT